jgi:hypothetical protein
MDMKLYVSILCEHSEYLGRLCAEVATNLSTLKQALNDWNVPTDADTAALLDELTRVQRCLSEDTEMLGKRIHFF